MEIKNQYLFNSLALEKRFRPAYHLEWDDISDSASKLLTGMLGREITVEARRSDYYCWSLDVYITPLSKNDMEIINSVAEADDYDRELQAYDEFPLTELGQGIAKKLLGKLTPFNVSISLADDEGVWLIGDYTDAAVLKTIAGKEEKPPVTN